jgi:hypothetical protein
VKIITKNKPINFSNIFLLVILIICIIDPCFPSGGYDHGTSTGKGQLELDFTWNPFDLIEFGQTYVVLGFGLTDRLDLHCYYAHQTDHQDNYYYGLFYQFMDSKYLDLASAIGKRHYTVSKIDDLFFPQLLFNIKFSKLLSLGGAFVNIQRITNDTLQSRGSAFDIALHLPLSPLIDLPSFIQEIKMVFGVFNPGVFDSDHGDFLPTYSIDITFNRFLKNK